MSHLSTLLGQPTSYFRILDNIVNRLSNLRNDFDSIAFSGMSGAFVGVAVAHRMGKIPVLVRKQGDNSHDYERMVISTEPPDRYIILDDFICSGATVKYIHSCLKEYPLTQCVGVFEYTTDSWTYAANLPILKD